MSQRRNVVNFAAKSPSSSPQSRNAKLDSLPRVVLRANWPTTPPFVEKAKRLHAAAPDLAAIVERLLDDVLLMVG